LSRREIVTYGPMSYFPIRRIVEEEIRKSGVKEGLVTVHAKGATPAIIVSKRDEIEKVDEAIRRIVPTLGWKHGNAYAHLRSTLLSTVKTLIVSSGELTLPTDYEIFFLETRFVYNHRRQLHFYIRGKC